MAYHEDLRERVRRCINNGGSQTKAATIFGVSRTTLYRWVNDLERAKNLGRKVPDKIDSSRLLNDVRLYPDKLLRERAELFGVTAAGISATLKRLRIKNTEISRKKP